MFYPYQVEHVEDQKQVVKGFVNGLEMQFATMPQFSLLSLQMQYCVKNKNMEKNQFSMVVMGRYNQLC